MLYGKGKRGARPDEDGCGLGRLGVGIMERPEMSGAAPADIGTAEARYWIGQALIRRRDFVGAAAESGAEPPVPWDEAYPRLRARLAQR